MISLPYSAVFVAGDGSWVVIREHSYSSSRGVDGKLEKALDAFYKTYRDAHQTSLRLAQAYDDALSNEHDEEFVLHL